MLNKSEYMGGENFDLRDILIRGRKMNLKKKTEFFDSFIDELLSNKQMLHLRVISSPADREVKVVDSYTGEVRSMLMFGSNNYLRFSQPSLHQRICLQNDSKIWCWNWRTSVAKWLYCTSS